MTVATKKHEFLANNTNKQTFNNTLSGHLQRRKKTFHASCDADLHNMQNSYTTTNTVFIWWWYDLFFLLIIHTNIESHKLFFQIEPTKNTKNQRVWNIKFIKHQLGPRVCTHILHIHAIRLCDTTSCMYDIGKRVALKCISRNEFRDQATELGTQSVSTPQQMVWYRERMSWCVCTMGSLGTDSTHYDTNVCLWEVYIQPYSLTPTSATSNYHSHMCVLADVDGNRLLPRDWGW